MNIFLKITSEYQHNFDGKLIFSMHFLLKTCTPTFDSSLFSFHRRPFFIRNLGLGLNCEFLENFPEFLLSMPFSAVFASNSKKISFFIQRFS